MKRVGTKMYDKHRTGKESPDKDETKWIETGTHNSKILKRFPVSYCFNIAQRKPHTVVDRTATTWTLENGVFLKKPMKMMVICYFVTQHYLCKIMLITGTSFKK